MAIVFDEKQKFNWTALIIFVAVILFVSFGAYFLFFTSAPAFELIIPANVQSTTDLSTVESLKSEDITQSKAYTKMNQSVIRATPSQAGRPNPFVKF